MPGGPDPERDGVSAWRIVDAMAFCQERFGAPYSEDGMRRILRQELNLSHQKARPVHPQARSTPGRGVSKTELPLRLATAREAQAGAEVQLWFMDEARIGQKDRACHRWDEKGERPQA
jgi:hypothetical protein